MVNVPKFDGFVKPTRNRQVAGPLRRELNMALLIAQHLLDSLHERQFQILLLLAEIL